jgi:hypothetical protein
MTRGSLRPLGAAVVLAAALAAPQTATAAPASGLKLTRPALSPATVTAGERVTVTTRVRNVRRRAVRRPKVRFFLSTGRTHSAADPLLGKRRLKRLRPRSRRVVRRKLTIPAGTDAGRYRLIACARRAKRRQRCALSKKVLVVRAPAALPVPDPAGDTTPPSVDVTTPGAGETTSLMRFAGQAEEAGEVTVRIFAGGTPIASQTVTPAGGAWSFTLSPVLPDAATYTVVAEQTDAAGNTGSDSHTFSVPPTLLAAGDIASCTSPGDEATVELLKERSGTVAAIGDTVYEFGTHQEASVENYAECYEPSWGQVKERTRPAVGNHEYNDLHGAEGYFEYFGASAGTPGQGYYSYDKGSWHVIVLNTSNGCGAVSCAAGQPQETWLRADLAANASKQCTVAYLHHPLFSSRLPEPDVEPLWDALYEHGVDVVLSAHAHQYERVRRMRPDGTPDEASGIRSFVVGTGGAELHAGAATSISEAFSSDTFGILDLTLGQGGYSYRFLPAPGGGGFSESGTGVCH